MSVTCLFCNQDVRYDYKQVDGGFSPEDNTFICARCGLISLDPMTRHNSFQLELTDETDNAKPGTKSAIRALQAWQYLIGKADNRQIIRYKEPRDLMDYRSDRPLTQILGNIMFYCEQNDLPPLTVIVVNKSGVPDGGFSAVPSPEYHQQREKVFDYPWFKLVPPSVGDFIKAREQNNQG